MYENIIWILFCLFCVNRLILWIIFFRKRSFGTYGTIVIIVNHIVSLSLPLVPQSRLELGLFWRFTGIILFIAGMFIIKIANDEFNKMKIKPNAITTDLITGGIYNKLRHPIYSGHNIYFAGWSLTWGAIHCFYFISIVFFLNWVQAFLEEKYILVKNFGDEYKEYRTRIGMFLPKWRKKD